MGTAKLVGQIVPLGDSAPEKRRSVAVLVYHKATGSRISGSRQPKNKVRCGIFINCLISSHILEVKKSEMCYSEPRSTTSKNGHIFG